MENDERIQRYVDGESVSSIAKAANISRQAIMKTLRSAGVYAGDGGVTPVTPLTEKMGGVTQGVTPSKRRGVTRDKYCPLDKVPVDVVVPEKGMDRIARNLWVGKNGWVVRHWHEGEMHEELYKSRGALLESYPQFK